MKTILIIFSFVLFFSGYGIVEFIYNGVKEGDSRLNNAWDIRMALIAIYTTVIYFAFTFKEDRFVRFVIPICIGGALDDAICKFQHDRDFHWYDMLIIITTAYLSYRKYIMNPK